LHILWEKSDGNYLSGQLCINHGGIVGLLEEQADILLSKIDSDIPGGRIDALELMLALTRINDDGKHTRRRLTLAEARLIAGGRKLDIKRGQKIIDYLSGSLLSNKVDPQLRGSLRLL